MVNIAQIFNRSGMMLTCKQGLAASRRPKDFKGKTLGVWFGGNEYPFLRWMDTLGLKTCGADADVKVLKQGFNVDPLLQNQAACISTMIYNEYWQMIDAGVKPDQLVIFPYEDQGVATLEDGLYALDAEAQGSRHRRQAGALPQGLDEGLGLRHQEPARGGQDRAQERHDGRADRAPSGAA